MFELSLVDHLRMTFGHVVYRHKAHARLSDARARLNRWLRAAEVVLMMGATVAASGAAFTPVRAYAVAAAVLSLLALSVLLARLAFDVERSAQVHAACAARLWHIREQYRAVLSDLADGAIDVDETRRRRDHLMEELHRIYDAAPAPDPSAFEAAGQAAAYEGALPDEAIDPFLPASLQKASRPAA